VKILVTGGAGFIGSRLCRYLVGNGHQVTAYDNLMLGRKELLGDLLQKRHFTFLERDLTLDADLSGTVSQHELVIHLAANSDILQGSRQTDLDYRHGILATYKVLEAMRTTDVKRIVFASTSAIYGEARVKPTPEDYGPLVPISLYGASKLASEALICAFAHNFGIRSWIFRFANVVGPNLTHGAIFDFVRRLRERPDRLSVLGNGKQSKSYLHVDDCISGIWFAVETAKAEVNIFNLTSGTVTDVKTIAEEVVRQMGNKARLEFGTEDRGWRGDVPVTWLDGGRLGALGWKPGHSSAEAVQLAVKHAVHGAGSQ